MLIIVALAVSLLFAAVSLVSKIFSGAGKGGVENNPIGSVLKSENKSIFNIRELNIKELENRIILLNVYNIRDFSYIFSVDLADRLEKIFKNKIVIIDVITEGQDIDDNTIINYIIKNNIERPTINVSKFDLGNDFKTDSKFFVLVNRDGMVADTFYGDDINEDKIKNSINTLLANTSRINTEKLSSISLEKYNNPETFIKSLNNIKYVRKIKDTDFGPYFIISDAKGRRIYMMTMDGNIVNQIGSGAVGNDDAASVNATFCYPAGIAVDNSEYLYVADTCNNSIRKVDLKTLNVQTVISNDRLIQKPLDLEVLDDKLIITSAGENPLVSYDLKFGDVSEIACEECGKYISKLVKYNNNLYFINASNETLYRLDKENMIEETIDLNNLNKSNGIELKGNYNFNIDETGIYIADKFKNRILKVKDKDIKEYSGNSSSQKIYDLPTDIIDLKDKLYITNEGNKKIIKLDKNTKKIEIINIGFGYEYNKIKLAEEEFLNINNMRELTISDGDKNKIILNLQNGYSFEKMAPQTLSVFKEDRDNNSAILIKSYTKNEILNNSILELPELDNNATYYLTGQFFYCNPKKETPCLVNKYNRKILSRNGAENTKIVVDFIYQ